MILNIKTTCSLNYLWHMPIKWNPDNVVVGMKRNYITLAVLLFVLPVVLGTVTISLLELALPNAIESPLLVRLAILPDLLASNFLQSLKLILFDLHLLAVKSMQNSDQVWGMYLSVSDIVLLAVTALLLSKAVASWGLLKRKQKWLLTLSALLCWSGLFDLWLSSCCSGGPDWWFEVIILSKAYVSNPYIDTINWQRIYQELSANSVSIRILLYVVGVALMRVSVRSHYSESGHSLL